MKRRSRLILLLLALLALAGLFRLRFDAEVLGLLPSASTAVRGLALYQQSIANARELILTVESPDPTSAEEAAARIARALRAQSNLVRRVVWRPAWRETPEVSAELMAFLWLNQAPSAFSNLVQRLEPVRAAQALAEARDRLATSFSPEELARLSYDPLRLTDLPGGPNPPAVGPALLASADGTFRVLFVEAAVPLPTYRECARWLARVKKQLATLQGQPDWPDPVRLGATGRPVFLSEIAVGMERDMTQSVAGTFVVIALLFFISHRRLKPMLWLAALMLLVLGGTMGLGGLFFGELNVISMGFAAILLGLSVDYGLVLYQESRFDPAPSVADVRRRVGPGIVWSALTTSLAFGLLGSSRLPGLAQLGLLVALGVLLAAFVMLAFFLQEAWRPMSSECRQRAGAQPHFWRWAAWGGLVVLLAAAWLVAGSPPGLDRSADALRPHTSPAYDTAERMQERLERPRAPLWLVMPHPTPQALDRAESVLSEAVQDGHLESFTLPGPLWPRAARQAVNRRLAERLAGRRSELREAFLAEGFTERAYALADRMLAVWERAAQARETFWPEHPQTRWILEQTLQADPPLAVGILHPSSPPRPDSPWVEGLRAALPEPRFLLTGWTYLGPEIFQLVVQDLKRLLVPMGAIVVACLFLAFRAVTPVLLSLATILASALLLLLVMKLCGWSWNLMNLMAVPLLFGAGIDYSLHMQLALRRHRGDTGRVRRSIGKAVTLCAVTTATGFGSLAFSSNAGLAGLGQVCATGLLLTCVVAVGLLPEWHRALERVGRSA